MRTIVIFGHQAAAMAVYHHVDASLRQRDVRDVALMFTLTVDITTANSLLQAGGELWFCGPAECTPAEWGGAGADRAHRQLLAATWTELQARTALAVRGFLEQGAAA